MMAQKSPGVMDTAPTTPEESNTGGSRNHLPRIPPPSSTTIPHLTGAGTATTTNNATTMSSLFHQHQHQQHHPPTTAMEATTIQTASSRSSQSGSFQHMLANAAAPMSTITTLGPSPLVQQQQQQHLASGGPPVQQVLYQAQQQHPLNTPWTLGSTDGTFATSVVLLQQQKMQAGGEVDGSMEGVEDPTLVLQALANKRSLYQDRLFRQPAAAVEAVLAAGCEVMGFEIAEMWLRTGPKTHQLTNSHLRPTALEDSVRDELVDVYYGEQSSERTHRLSPALCKRAKEANDVVWVTAHTQHGAEALSCSISNVRTAVAIPVCHEASNTNITVIFFSIRKIMVRPAAVEYLVHVALAAGVASVNSLSQDSSMERDHLNNNKNSNNVLPNNNKMSAKESGGLSASDPNHTAGISDPSKDTESPGIAIRHHRPDQYSVRGAKLDLQWRQLQNVEYLTDGGNSWIHTAVFQGKPVVVKTLKPECQDVAVAINEIEAELAIHSRLSHPNIVELIGAGTTSRGVRFVVLERLDGGTLTQMLGYDTRIRDRRRRFWRKKQLSFQDVIRIARSIAAAMKYCHEEAIPGCIVLHRDLKPDNIGFTLDGTVKLYDFGLAKVIENASVNSDDVYTMSGETGSLRYMAPEVADGLPYNHTADVYSFAIVLWELHAGKKPFDGLNRESFYERIVHGGERPHMHRKWPQVFKDLLSQCWDDDIQNRPKFSAIVERLDGMLEKDKGGPSRQKKPFMPKISGMIDRHSTWF